jgi:hypothetical protein
MIHPDWELQLFDRLQKLEREHRDLKAKFAIMQTFFVKEFPKFFAGETAIGIVTNGEILGGEPLPDIAPIDLRTEEEKASGEAFHLSDMVDMGACLAETT